MAPTSLLALDDARHVGLTAAELVANRIRARPRLRVLLPTGHTPRGLYAALRNHAADGSLPSDEVTVLGLDEYLGLGAGDPLSFRAALDRELAGIPIGRREALDGAAGDPEAEAAPYFFAPYRAFGLDVDQCPARPLRGWAHLLSEELGGLAGMARQRRAAMDAVRLPEGP
jgi:glucosamine-6-phosphate deaminase